VRNILRACLNHAREFGERIYKVYGHRPSEIFWDDLIVYCMARDLKNHSDIESVSWHSRVLCRAPFTVLLEAYLMKTLKV
jgi:hypothetical protein